MAVATEAPAIKHQYFDNNGLVAASYRLFFYASGSSVKQTAYTDPALSVALANPYTLDASGRISGSGDIFFPAGQVFKVVFALPGTDDPPASPVWTIDGLAAVPPGSTSADVDVAATAGENLAAGDSVYESDGSGGNTAGRWYRTTSANTYSSSTAQATGFATAAITSGASGTVRRNGRMTGLSGLVSGTVYYAAAGAGALTSTAPANARVVLQADSSTSGVILSGPPDATATVGGQISLGTQTLGTGTKTVDGIAVNSTPNYKPGGDSALDALASGVLTPSIDTTQHANSGTGLTTLSSYSLPANTLSANGKAIRITAWGTFAANGNTKTISVKFGATTATLESGAVNGTAYYIQCIVIRTGAATQKMFSVSIDRTGTAFPVSSAPTETLSGAVTILTQGQSGTASSDILQECFFVEVLG